ncbi:hypothetical protein GmHk_11G032250 [Glycine max]|nr:hypothetical protein GmHk_11G032250 [Glycine max]
MNPVKTVFPECTNLLCRFHIDKNVKTKCKFLVGKKNAWDYLMFIDYVNQTWIISHKEKFVKACTNKVEYAHWALKRLLQNSLGDLCIHIWLDMFLTLPYTNKLLDIVSRYALNQIAAKYERVSYTGIDSSHCGCVMRTTHGLPCACKLARYVVGSIPLGRLSFSDQRLSEPEVSITEEMETIFKPSTKRDLSYWKYVDILHFVQNSNSSDKRSASSSDQGIPRKTMPKLDQFHLCIHDYIENIVDVKADGNCGYYAITALLGMGEDSWSLVTMDK